jgi:hypothetical protein
MGRARFSIAGTLLAIAGTAVALTALREATEFWLGVVATLTALGLLFAIVRAATGPVRAFWAGCALRGGLYLLLVFSPWLRVHVGPRLPIDGLLERAHDSLGIQPRPRYERYDDTGRVVMRAVFVAKDGTAQQQPTAQQVAVSLLSMGDTSILPSDPDTLPSFPLKPPWVKASVIADDRQIFDRIGHLLVAWALALLSGLSVLAVRSLIRRRRAVSP